MLVGRSIARCKQGPDPVRHDAPGVVKVEGVRRRRHGVHVESVAGEGVKGGRGRGAGSEGGMQVERGGLVNTVGV